MTLSVTDWTRDQLDSTRDQIDLSQRSTRPADETATLRRHPDEADTIPKLVALDTLVEVEVGSLFENNPTSLELFREVLVADRHRRLSEAGVGTAIETLRGQARPVPAFDLHPCWSVHSETASRGRTGAAGYD
jgi:hypothetical protein